MKDAGVSDIRGTLVGPLLEGTPSKGLLPGLCFGVPYPRCRSPNALSEDALKTLRKFRDPL